MPRRKKDISAVDMSQPSEITDAPIKWQISLPQYSLYRNWFDCITTKSWIQEFEGGGGTLYLAKLDAAQKAIDFFTSRLNEAHWDYRYLGTLQESLVWATAYYEAVKNGVNIIYQYPKQITVWRMTKTNRWISEDGKIPECDSYRWPIFIRYDLVPLFPFVGFGRSEQEAKTNAYIFLLNQYTLRLRHAAENTQIQSVIKSAIDNLNAEINICKSRLDIFQQVKGISKPTEAWSEAPKPVESEPIKVAS